MIQCGECGFPVNDTMRYALMQNSCPGCGSALFSNKDSHIIDMIQGKLVSESFSEGFNEETLYDISLFMFNELKYGIGKQLRDELAIPNASSDDIDYSEESDAEAKIRKEVEAELEEQMVLLTGDGEVQEEEVFSKAERLKRLHAQKVRANPKITRGTINSGSKRGGGFGGISRAE